jgi:hypothetical protein
MSTLVVNLPIVSGGIGAAVSTAQFAAAKTVIGSGITGTVTVEASVDGVSFCPVGTLTPTVTDLIVDVACSEMRLNAEQGDAGTLCVQAEGSQTRSASIPLPPADGPGASLDISLFGPFTTVGVEGLTAGQVGFEISCDDTNWTPDFKSFTADGCFTKEISASFIRAVGTGAAVTSIGITSEESCCGAALTEPRTCFIFAPSQVQNGTTYNDFDDLMDALDATPGENTICYPTFDEGGTITVPGPATPGRVYNLQDVHQVITDPEGGGVVIFDDAAGANPILFDGPPKFGAFNFGTFVFNLATPCVVIPGGLQVMSTDRGEIFVRNDGTSVWALIGGSGGFARMPIAMGGRGFNLLGTDASPIPSTFEHVEMVDAPSSVNMNSNSGANTMGANCFRGAGALNFRTMGGTYKAGLGFQPENQANHSGVIGTFQGPQSIGDGRIKTNPDDGTYFAVAQNPVPHGNHNKYEQTDGEGGPIAETLPSAFGHEGQRVRITNRNGSLATVTVALEVPAQILEGNVTASGVGGTDTVLAGTSRTYEVMSAGYAGAVPAWQLVNIA